MFYFEDLVFLRFGAGLNLDACLRHFMFMKQGACCEYGIEPFFSFWFEAETSLTCAEFGVVISRFAFIFMLGNSVSVNVSRAFASAIKIFSQFFLYIDVCVI